MKAKKTRLGFVDFWEDFNPKEHFLVKTLREQYEVEIDNINPDFLFYSCFGIEHLEYNNIVKIFYTGENIFPNYNICDYSLSHIRDSINGRNLHLPFFSTCHEGNYNIPNVNEDMTHRRFCNFIYSQDHLGEGAVLRKLFCETLMKYKEVDCPGQILHNMEAPELSCRRAENWQTSKIDFLRKYKFTIAFENSNTDGYITEKLTQPLLAGSVPIYWGSEGNVEPFPKDCMICANDYPDVDSLIQKIKEIDEDDEQYMRMCQANPLRGDFKYNSKASYLRFFNTIFEKGKHPLKKDPLQLDSTNQLSNNPYVSFALSVRRWVNSHSGLKKCIKYVKEKF